MPAGQSTSIAPDCLGSDQLLDPADKAFDTNRMKPDWNSAIQEHLAVVERLAEAREVVERIVESIIAALRANGKVVLAGNGGSAADAQHIAAELVGRFRVDRAALPAIALTTDTSALTAISNDFGFERVFARQVEALLRPPDVFWALSTSGNSPNVLAALRAARALGCVTIGFSGRGGGEMAELCTHLLCVPHDRSDRIQEAHALAYHYICERIEDNSRGVKPPPHK